MRRTRASAADGGSAGETAQRALEQAALGPDPAKAFLKSGMQAVRSNWSLTAPEVARLRCALNVRLHLRGGLLQADMSRSSGNALFDASALQAVKRTGDAGQFPLPPSPACT